MSFSLSFTIGIAALRPSGEPAPAAPDAFGDNGWAVADRAANSTDISVTIDDLPEDYDGANPVVEVRQALFDGDEFGAYADEETLVDPAATGAFHVAAAEMGVLTSVQVRLVTDNGEGPWSEAKTVEPTGVPAANGTPTLATIGSDEGDLVIPIAPWFTNLHFPTSVVVQSTSPSTTRASIATGDAGFDLVIAGGSALEETDVVVRVTNAEGTADQTFPVEVTFVADPIVDDLLEVTPTTATLQNSDPWNPATGAAWTRVGGTATSAETRGEVAGSLITNAVSQAGHGQTFSLSATSGTTYTFLILVDQGTATAWNLRLDGTASTGGIGELRFNWSSPGTAATNDASEGAFTITYHGVFGDGHLYQIAWACTVTATFSCRIGTGLSAGSNWVGGCAVFTGTLNADAEIEVLANDVQTRVTEVRAASGKVGAPILLGTAGLGLMDSGGTLTVHTANGISATSSVIDVAYTADDGAGANIASGQCQIHGGDLALTAAVDDTAAVGNRGGSVLGTQAMTPTATGGEWSDDINADTGTTITNGSSDGDFTPSVITSGTDILGPRRWEGRQRAVTVTAGQVVGITWWVREVDAPLISFYVGAETAPSSGVFVATYRDFTWTSINAGTPTAVQSADAAGLFEPLGPPVKVGEWVYYRGTMTTNYAGLLRPKVTTAADDASEEGSVEVGAIIICNGAPSGVVSGNVLTNDNGRIRVTAVDGSAGKVGKPIVDGTAVTIIAADGSYTCVGGAQFASASDSISVTYEADDGAGGNVDTATLTITGSAAAPAPTTGVYWTDSHPQLTQRLMRAGPDRLVVEYIDGVTTYGQWNSSTKQRSPEAVRVATPWGGFNVATASWTITSVGGSAVTGTTLARFTVPNQKYVGETTRCDRGRVTLDLSRNLTNGETLNVDPGTADKRASITVGPTMRSAVVQVPAHGFSTGDAEKWALVGGWFGRSGADAIVNTDDTLSTSTRFEIYDVNNVATPVSGWALSDNKTLTLAKSGTTTLTYSGSNDNWTTDFNVYKADFSSFSTPGRYILSVENHGGSAPFEIKAGVHQELFYHVHRAIMVAEHGDDKKIQSAALPPVWHIPETLNNLRKIPTARTSASARNDGMNADATFEMKAWQNPTASDGFMIPENDSILGAFAMDTPIEGVRDAADIDFRPVHLPPFCAMAAMALAIPWLRSLDLGRGERTAGAARAYSKTIHGAAITGSVVLGDIHHMVFNVVDACSRMQVLRTAGSWTSTLIPSGSLSGTGHGYGGSVDWTGAASAAYEVGDYMTNKPLFYEASAVELNSPGETLGSAENAYAIRRLRPCPWSTYAACAGFAVAKLMATQIGDTTLANIYQARAQAAWDWAEANEAVDRTLSYTDSASASRTLPNWRGAWRTATERPRRYWTDTKGAAAVAMWAMTGTSSYYDAALSVTGNWSRGRSGEWSSAAMLFAGLWAAGLISPSAAQVTVFKAGPVDFCKDTLDRMNTASQNIFGRPTQSSASLRTNRNESQPHNAFPLCIGLLSQIADPSSLTSTEFTELKKVIVNEIGFLAGRAPGGQAFIGMLGDNPQRDLQLYLNYYSGQSFPPPGFVSYGLLPNGDFSGTSTVSVARNGYSVSGTYSGTPAVLATPTAAQLLKLPYLYRSCNFNGVWNQGGEFLINRSVLETLMVAAAAHHVAEDL